MASADRSGETSRPQTLKRVGDVQPSGSSSEDSLPQTLPTDRNQKPNPKDSIFEQSEPFLHVVFYPWCIRLKLKLKMCSKQYRVCELLEMHLAAAEQP